MSCFLQSVFPAHLCATSSPQIEDLDELLGTRKGVLQDIDSWYERYPILCTIGFMAVSFVVLSISSAGIRKRIKKYVQKKKKKNGEYVANNYSGT